MTQAQRAAPGKRVLLLDDSEPLRTVLRFFLEHAGYQVGEAASMLEARAAVAAGGWDAVFLDVMLPDGRGTDLIPEVRSALPGAKVVVLTGVDKVDARGADLVLMKQDPAEIVRRFGAL